MSVAAAGDVERDPLAERRAATAREQKGAIRDLIGSKGWAMIAAIAKSQIEQRTLQVMLTPIGEGDPSRLPHTIERQEFLKGEVAGMRLLLGLPRQMVEEAEALLEALSESPQGSQGGRGDAE